MFNFLLDVAHLYVYFPFSLLIFSLLILRYPIGSRIFISNSVERFERSNKYIFLVFEKTADSSVQNVAVIDEEK